MTQIRWKFWNKSTEWPVINCLVLVLIVSKTRLPKTHSVRLRICSSLSGYLSETNPNDEIYVKLVKYNKNLYVLGNFKNSQYLYRHRLYYRTFTNSSTFSTVFISKLTQAFWFNLSIRISIWISAKPKIQYVQSNYNLMINHYITFEVSREYLCLRQIDEFVMFSTLVHLCVSRRVQPGPHVILNSRQELPGTQNHLNPDLDGAPEHKSDLKRLIFWKTPRNENKTKEIQELNGDVEHL